jgi:hypothetical protein
LFLRFPRKPVLSMKKISIPAKDNFFLKLIYNIFPIIPNNILHGILFAVVKNTSQNKKSLN